MTKQLVVTSAFLVWVSASIAWGGTVDHESKSVYSTVETYRQVLEIDSFADADKLPSPRLAAVYDGRKWGLSTRWDDSNPNALNVRRKMLENGIRGTFYLNSREPEVQRTSLAHKLTELAQCSVGGHSVSHPHLPKLPVNEVFFELMANRIALECLTDQPVNSLAFPFGDYQEQDRPEVLVGITAAVLRTGYHHCVYAGFANRNPLLSDNLVSTGLQVVPGDRRVDAAKFWKQMETIRHLDTQSRKTSDCIFLGVHPWQQGEELERLGEVMKKLSTWDDFWHCTQTEYAAFVKQRRNTTVEKMAAGHYAIIRPCAFELGSEIPLTLVFDSSSVHAAKVDGTTCTLRQAGGKTIVNVPHAQLQGVPTKIDATSEGTAMKFPGLKASLTFNPVTGTIGYTLENAADVPLSQAALTVSTPPAFEPGILRWKREEVVNSGKWSVTDTLTQGRTGPYWHDGTYYIVAQLDFILDGKRGRLFTTHTTTRAGATRK